MAIAPLLTMLAAVQAGPASAPDPREAYGFLWEMAGACYGFSYGPPSHWGRRICLRRDGAVLRMTDYRGHPRFSTTDQCVIEPVGARRLSIRCSDEVGRPSGTQEAWLERDRLILSGPHERHRAIWVRHGNGLEVVNQDHRDGLWQRQAGLRALGPPTFLPRN